MIREWRLAGKTVGVLAVDPSSRPELGGGALLGDRIRIKNASHDEGLFIRSLANRNQLGGVATEVWPMSWLMLACFDIVVVETVGVGQTEIDIAEIGDTVCYVAQPASGDTIQYLKSGIIEIPDVFAVNKSDLGAPAHKTASEIGRSAPRQDRRDELGLPGVSGERNDEYRDTGSCMRILTDIAAFSLRPACWANCALVTRALG
jgi:LAO/AO transport system kinase